jgi:acetoin utilization deacetylase AcuC-like enzyme
MSVGIVWDERYMKHGAAGHPERPERLRTVRDALREAGLWEALVPIEPEEITQEALHRVHTEEHVARVAATAEEERITWFDMDTYAGPDSYRAALLAAGGVCAAVDAVVVGTVRSTFCAVRPPGHHATADRAMGFCLFNNVAVAARHAQAAPDIERVLIVDFDVHHGNGTQAIFETDPTVFYVSTHQWPHYPGTGSASETGRGDGKGTVRNVPLSAGSGDEEVLAALGEALREAAAFRPQLVLVSAGFDAHGSDPLAGLDLTDAGYAAMTRRIRAVAEKHAAGRVVSVLEGGYELAALSRSVVAHVRALLEPPDSP